MDIAWIEAWTIMIYGLAIYALWGGLNFLNKRHPKLSEFLHFALVVTVLYSSALEGRYILASICFAYILIDILVIRDSD